MLILTNQFEIINVTSEENVHRCGIMRGREKRQAQIHKLRLTFCHILSEGDLHVGACVQVNALEPLIP